MSSKKKYKAKKATKVISYVVILLLLVSSCGAIVFFTNGFTTDFKSFYVQAAGNDYLTDTENFILDSDNLNRFDIKYTFGILNKELSGYSVKIVPNVSHDNDFDFTVDGETVSFSSIEDLTKGFDIEQYEDYFTLDGNYSMQSVLDRVYEGKEVVIEEGSVNWGVDNFTLLVYSYNGEAVIKLGFRNFVAVEGVELPTTMEF